MFNWRNKLILCSILVLSIFILQQIPAQGQENLNGHWASVDLWELQARGVIGEKDIDPERYITRADFTEMIVTSLGLKLEALRLQGVPSVFHDVPDNHPQKGFINVALERGLVGGYTPEIFRPDEELRRDQMIVLLLRAMGSSGLQANDSHLRFADVKHIPNYALPSINEGVKLGLVAGFSDNTFRPGEKVTLAQGAAFINRWLELMGDRYDFTGPLVTVDQQKKTIMLEVAGAILSFPLKPESEVLINGQRADWSALEEKSQTNIKLNVLGEVILVHQKEVELAEVDFYLNARRLPRLDIDQPLPQVASLFNPRVPLDTESIEKSLNTTKAEINIPSLVSSTKSDGRGQIVAIIDTGVDPSHPDLAVTTEGKPKLVEWVDFTLEGIVNISLIPKVDGNALVLEESKYNLGDIPSRSGIYRMGYLNLNDIVPLELVDRNNPLKVAVLLTDSTTRGVYDTVYIDTNDDQSFVGERALKLFKKDQSYVSIEHKGADLALALVDISPQGTYIQLANDISGHGTHVAGIIGANGRLQGVAPGAQLMVLKAVDRDGFANPENIMEAIRYAAIHGADVINISLGQYQDFDPGQSELSKLVDEVVQRYNVVVVAAAGNIGPGVSTVASPADADHTISVGAFVSPRMWQVDFEYNVPEDSLYYFSSVGPRRDGAWYPSIIAPGSAVSTVPLWMGYDYLLTEGTSMAAPHVSGVVAHLLENAKRNGIKTTPALIKRAIEESARDLNKLTVIEDGHGVLNAYGAWLKLQELKGERKIQVEIFNPEFGGGTGIFAREYTPARLTLNLTNTDTIDYLLEWQASEPWIKPELKTSHIMRGSKREIPIAFDLPNKPGLYSGVLIGNDPKHPGVEVEVPINIIVGEKVQNLRPQIYTEMGRLGPAQLSRYFVHVPQGLTSINAGLEVFPSTSGNFEGRARLHLINPFGLEERMSDYAGLGPHGLSRRNKVEAMTFFPEPGTWEVVVYSSAALSQYNVKETKYQLTVRYGDIIEINEVLAPDLDLVVSPIPEKALRKDQGNIVLHIWDNDTNKPFSGALEVNGRLYQIQNGRLEYDVAKVKENMRLRLTLLR